MLLGAAGIVTSLTSLLLSFADATGGETTRRIVALVIGLVVLRLLAGSRAVDRALTELTEWALRRYTRLNVRDYDKLLHISDEFTVAEVEPREGDWLLGRRLEELELRQEGSSSWASTAATAATSGSRAGRRWSSPATGWSSTARRTASSR